MRVGWLLWAGVLAVLGATACVRPPPRPASSYASRAASPGVDATCPSDRLFFLRFDDDGGEWRSGCGWAHYFGADGIEVASRRRALTIEEGDAEGSAGDAASGGGGTYVHGYTRRDGTHVRGYRRRR